MTLYIGTSGWAFPEWKPAFYPPELPRRAWLTHYSSIFNTCEVNNTFRARPAPEVVRRWAAETPPGFSFSLKANRFITHGKSIAPEGNRAGYLSGFMEVARELGDKLGTCLFQFPPHRERDDDDLAALLAALPTDPPVALEFRHESWRAPEVEAAIVDAGHVLCFAEWEGRAPDRLPPGRIAYVRLRGESYSDGQRDAWRELLIVEGAQRDVYAFGKHESTEPGDVTAGLGFARWLTERLAPGTKS
ncbi:MAG TPA: DUF72 domain-containing protein [Actinomycetota bacterium]|nr:DUF72 domain-containing protein [Actinomycetota bacterium]